jgi:transcriptional antiterminator NusG
MAPIFSGYVFVVTSSISPELFRTLRGTPGFYRFLRSNTDIAALSERDARILSALLQYGEVVGKSVAEFDPNNRIRVLEGPLKGLEGQIIKVDRRKGRVRVKLDLYEESHAVDFGFTSVEHAEDHSENTRG